MTSVVAEHTSESIKLSPGERVQRVSEIFRNYRDEIAALVNSESMRDLVAKQLDKAETTACRAVLQGK